MKTVGQILSIERNSKKLSINDIAIELKISKSIIIDLENDNIKNKLEKVINIVNEFNQIEKNINYEFYNSNEEFGLNLKSYYSLKTI